MGTVARVEASVYQGTACDRLAPSRALPPPLPLGVKDADGSSAVLEFPDLLDRDHALLGRALDDKGRIVASGCVDLSAGQVLPGETVAVPVPLVLTSVNLDGSFRLKLHAAFSPVPPAVAQPTAAWDTLTACPSGAAQPLLDRLVIALGADPLAVEIQRRRGPPDLHGCRPAQRTEGGQIVATLDEALHALLYLKDSPAQLLPDIVATLDALAGAVDVEGSMDFALVAANQYTATHRLGQVGFAVGERAVNYDLAALGLPLLVAEGVAVSVQGQRVSIGPHGFTLRVGALWQRAFEEIEAALLPSGPSIEPEALLSAVLGAATRPGPPMSPPLHGCLAVEDLLCQAIGANACSLAPACATAASAQAEAMRAPFSPVLGIDFTLSGGGMATDSKGAAHADQIESGVFDVAARVGAPVVPLGAQAAFRAARLE